MENPDLARRCLKRKVELEDDQTDPNVEQPCANFSTEILQQVSLLNSALSPSASDSAAVKSAVLAIVKLIKKVLPRTPVEDLIMDTLLSCGVVPLIVRHLQAVKDDGDGVTQPFQHEVEKGCAFILMFLAIKPEHQQLIIDAGALPCLIDLLRMQKISTISRPLIGLLRRAADAIFNLARKNTIIKTLVRMEGGIPPLVELLEFNVTKVQRAAVVALRTVAFTNDDNKKLIVECNALPTLVLMLRSEDPTIRYAAVSVIEILVHSLPNIQKDVLQAGALQPVICLLSDSSCDANSQRAAALLLGLFAAPDSDCKVHISQRGAIPPLVDMLKSPDAQLQEMSAFALMRLAQDSHNQASIAHNGGIEPLLNLLDSDNARIQCHAAYALYRLADNEDIVADIIKAGGFQKLKDGHFRDHRTKEFVANTLKRLEKMQGQVLKQLIYLMRFAEKGVQRCVAIALAYLCSPPDCKTIFIDNNGLELLLDILKSPNIKQKGDASAALHKLATKASFDAAPPSTTPQMYLGEEYVNNAKLSDVTFLVEGGASAAIIYNKFQAMFNSGYREREAKHVVIPNIKWDALELMMRFIYTGTVDINLDIAQDPLSAPDEYLPDGLKRICENAIARDISVENVLLIYKMSQNFNASTLKHACILFMLEKFDELLSRPWYSLLVRRIVPDIRMCFSTLLTKSHPADS